MSKKNICMKCKKEFGTTQLLTKHENRKKSCYYDRLEILNEQIKLYSDKIKKNDEISIETTAADTGAARAKPIFFELNFCLDYFPSNSFQLHFQIAFHIERLLLFQIPESEATLVHLKANDLQSQ
mgnify:CR=1 FL=1